MSFPEMLLAYRHGAEISQRSLAAALGISSQYLSDLEHGRRRPSVAIVDRICEYLGRGPFGRHEWHFAAARAHGWALPTPPAPPPGKGE